MPRVACGVDVRTQLAEPRVCAASQEGGAMFVFGYADSALTMTISGVTITGCSAEAGGDYGVRARHAAQRGALRWGCWGDRGRGAACGVRRGRAHAAGEPVRWGTLRTDYERGVGRYERGPNE